MALKLQSSSVSLFPLPGCSKEGLRVTERWDPSDHQEFHMEVPQNGKDSFQSGRGMGLHSVPSTEGTFNSVWRLFLIDPRDELVWYLVEGGNA